MTVKVAVLKSGENIVADIKEMVVGEGEESRIVGYFFEFPYVVHIRNPELVVNGGESASPFQLEISLFTWNPLSKDHVIPVGTDWVVTIVEPVTKLKEMYETLIDKLKKGETKKDEESDSKDISNDEQSDSDQPN